MQMRAQLLSGATSVAHLIGIGARPPRAARPQPPVVAGTPATPPAGATEAGGEGGEAPQAGTPAGDDAAAVEAAAQEAAAAAQAAAAQAAAAQAAAKAAPPADEDDGEDDDDEKDDDPKEMAGSGKKAMARRRERARCRAILNSDAAQRNPAVAMQLALNSAMPRQQVLAMLEAMPQGAGGLDARMASIPNAKLGAGAAASPGKPDGHAIQASWATAFAAVPGSRIKAAAGAPEDTASSWDRALARV